MAAKTAAEKAEEDRRSKLTPEQREAEDAALLRQMEEEERAANDAAARGPVAAVDRAAVTQRVREANEAQREKLATVEATVAVGHLYTHANQAVPFKRGDKVMLTPQEHATLVASGHVFGAGGTVAEPVGPSVYKDAGLLVGHAPNQGQAPDGGKK